MQHFLATVPTGFIVLAVIVIFAGFVFAKVVGFSGIAIMPLLLLGAAMASEAAILGLILYLGFHAKTGLSYGSFLAGMAIPVWFSNRSRLTDINARTHNRRISQLYFGGNNGSKTRQMNDLVKNKS